MSVSKNQAGKSYAYIINEKVTELVSGWAIYSRKYADKPYSVACPPPSWGAILGRRPEMHPLIRYICQEYKAHYNHLIEITIKEEGI